LDVILNMIGLLKLLLVIKVNNFALISFFRIHFQNEAIQYLKSCHSEVGTLAQHTKKKKKLCLAEIRTIGLQLPSRLKRTTREMTLAPKPSSPIDKDNLEVGDRRLRRKLN
jgi:hypothetical protein